MRGDDIFSLPAKTFTLVLNVIHQTSFSWYYILHGVESMEMSNKTISQHLIAKSVTIILILNLNSLSESAKETMKWMTLFRN